jgi:hypothetical protein
VHVTTPADPINISYDLMTDTVLDPGTMLITNEQPPLWPLSFRATIVAHGPQP